MAPNLAAPQRGPIRDMILDESLIIYFASRSIRNMLELLGGNIPVEVNSSRHSI
jgi:hypothetical protein